VDCEGLKALLRHELGALEELFGRQESGLRFCPYPRPYEAGLFGGADRTLVSFRSRGPGAKHQLESRDVASLRAGPLSFRAVDCVLDALVYFHQEEPLASLQQQVSTFLCLADLVFD